MRAEYYPSLHTPNLALETLPSTLPGFLSRTLPIVLDGTLPACLNIRSQISSQDALKYTPNFTRWHTPCLLDYILLSKLSRHSQIHSEYAPKYTSVYPLKFTPRHPVKDSFNGTRLHTPSLIHCTLPSNLSRRSEAHSRACSQLHFRARSQLHSQFHLMAHSQPAWLYAPK